MTFFLAFEHHHDARTREEVIFCPMPGVLGQGYASSWPTNECYLLVGPLICCSIWFIGNRFDQVYSLVYPNYKLAYFVILLI